MGFDNELLFISAEDIAIGDAGSSGLVAELGLGEKWCGASECGDKQREKAQGQRLLFGGDGVV